MPPPPGKHGHHSADPPIHPSPSQSISGPGAKEGPPGTLLTPPRLNLPGMKPGRPPLSPPGPLLILQPPLGMKPDPGRWRGQGEDSERTERGLREDSERTERGQ
uniref:Uncharacterized protein n=1 Tax=Knipowitschia caucasica TaxID=637954 RepID=A0AAV2KYU0_KNICA